MTAPLLDEETSTDTYTYEPGDHERMSHYVLKDALMKAAIEGVPARAICGKVWVPTRDGERFPVCPDCHAIYNDPNRYPSGREGN